MPIILITQNLSYADITSENHANNLQLSYLTKYVQQKYSETKLIKDKYSRNTLETLVWGKPAKRGFIMAREENIIATKTQKFLLSTLFFFSANQLS
jgi:hypothetical protein